MKVFIIRYGKFRVGYVKTALILYQHSNIPITNVYDS